MSQVRGEEVQVYDTRAQHSPACAAAHTSFQVDNQKHRKHRFRVFIL